MVSERLPSDAGGVQSPLSPSSMSGRTRRQSIRADVRRRVSLAGVYASKRGYSGRVLGLTARDAPRRQAIWLIEQPWFDGGILFVILVNTLLLGIEGPSASPPQWIERTTLSFLCVFTAEVVLKVIASGLYRDRHAYLRSYWNVLDLTVVLTGWAPYIFPGAQSVSALRVLRALRPLRSINRLPSLRALIDAMVRALPQLVNVSLLLAFVCIASAIAGMQLFKGVLRFRCIDAALLAGAPGGTDVVAALAQRVADADAFRVCRPAASAAGTYISGEQGTCASGELCVELANPMSGTVSFDSFGEALLTIFSILTLEGWADVMWLQVDAVGWPAVAYCVTLVVVGALALLNLLRAIICDTFVPADTVKPTRPNMRAARSMSSAEQWWDKTFGAHARQVLIHPGFVPTVIGATLLNTALLCCYSYGMEDALRSNLDTVGFALSAVFLVEMVVKLSALGVRAYTRDPFNLLDGLVVAESIIEIALALAGLDKVGGLNQLRSLRLLRVLKLMSASDSTKELLAMMMASLAALRSLLFLIALVLCVFAIIGMQLFGQLPSATRDNFSNFGQALLATFVVMTGDGWTALMAGYYTHAPMTSAAYFVSLIVVSNYVLLNLIIAIMLAAFDDLDDDDDDKTGGGDGGGGGDGELVSGGITHNAGGGGAAPEPPSACAASCPAPARAHLYRYRSTLSAAPAPPSAHSFYAPKAAPAPVSKDEFMGMFSEVYAQERAMLTTCSASDVGTGAPAQSKEVVRLAKRLGNHALLAGPAMNRGSSLTLLVDEPSSAQDDELRARGWLERITLGDRALMLFPPKARLRTLAGRIARSHALSACVLVLTVASSMLVATEPVTDAALRAASPAALHALHWAELAIAVLFALEVTVHAVADGLIWPAPTAYLRNSWNQLDFAVVLASILAFVPCGVRLESLNLAQTMRTLRPLRLLSRYEGTRTVMSSLVTSLPAVTGVIAVCLCFNIVFAVLGQQLFGGRFARCSDGSAVDEAECVGVFAPDPLWPGAVEPREWRNPPFGSFDSVPDASLLLLESSSLEGWTDVMRWASDSGEPGRAPSEGGTPWAPAFFVLWVMLGGFFSVNLFVGVVVETFSACKKAEEGSLFMTVEQRRWVKLQTSMYLSKLHARPARPREDGGRYARLRAHVFDLVSSSRFENAVMGAIIVATASVALDAYEQPAWRVQVLSHVSTVLLVAFTSEAALKIVAYGPSRYFASPWDRFDFALVVASLLDAAASALLSAASGVNPALIRALRIARIARVARAARVGSSMRTLLATASLAVPALLNVLLVMLVLLFSFAVLARHLFGAIREGLEAIEPEHRNFADVGRALLVLFESATGETWCGMMHDLRRADCAAVGTRGCTPWAAVPFYMAFVLVAAFVLINVVVAIVIETHSDVQNEQQDEQVRATIDCAHLRARPRAWCCAAPSAPSSPPRSATAQRATHTCARAPGGERAAPGCVQERVVRARSGRRRSHPGQLAARAGRAHAAPARAARLAAPPAYVRTSRRTALHRATQDDRLDARARLGDRLPRGARRVRRALHARHLRRGDAPAVRHDRIATRAV